MQDIVLFGTGDVGKWAVPFLEEDGQILFWVDNDERKWGSVFENYIVKSPEAVMQCDCDIVVTSTKYASEIAGQLQAMGVSTDKIFFCRRFRAGDVYRYEAYPFAEDNVRSTGMSLVQYDLCKTEEKETNCRKVLILCTFFSTYTKQLIENIGKSFHDIEFSLLTNAKESKEKIFLNQLKHIYYFQTMSDLKTILMQLPTYDVMQIQFMEHEWAYFHKLIREKSKRLNLNMGGSDFYRAVEGERAYKRDLVECADCIVAQTEETMQNFGAYYGERVKSKTVILPYGIEVLEMINNSECISKNTLKQKYYIPEDKIIVTCGHNADEAHQHLKIIDALSKLPLSVKTQIICVFPMTYPEGKDEYINGIRARLDETDIEYVILTKFMSFQEMAEYALISDIMIHVQTTDQLSSAMLEEMYAGSIIIAGKWLPYNSLHEKGIFFLDVDTISDVISVMEEVIANISEYKEKCKGNRGIIWKNSSWNELALRWNALWEK